MSKEKVDFWTRQKERAERELAELVKPAAPAAPDPKPAVPPPAPPVAKPDAPQLSPLDAFKLDVEGRFSSIRSDMEALANGRSAPDPAPVVPPAAPAAPAAPGAAPESPAERLFPFSLFG